MTDETTSDQTMGRSRMFPLGNVLFPGSPLPLHIFEPRYRTMLAEAIADNGTFGVTLITHGTEVGGGDQRSMIGTMARLDDHQWLDDGRAVATATGQGRIEVVEWLVDDPYPQAVVIERPDQAIGADDPRALESAVSEFCSLLDLAHRLGRLRTRPEPAFDDDTTRATWQLAAMVPIGPYDRQAILAADSVGDRLERLRAHIGELADDLGRIE